MVFMVQSELYGKVSLRQWLQQTNRRRKTTIITFLEQVSALSIIYCMRYLLQNLYCMQILDALCYAHDAINQSLGLNPTNIFLDPNRESSLKIHDTRLVDCALCKFLSQDTFYFTQSMQLTESLTEVRLACLVKGPACFSQFLLHTYLHICQSKKAMVIKITGFSDLPASSF